MTTPAMVFDDKMRLWHNGDSLALAHYDPAHTDTDIYVHFEKANVLHMGDTWFNGFYPFIDESSGGIRGVMAIGEGTPRLGQQLVATGLKEASGKAVQSVMKADRFDLDFAGGQRRS